MQLLKLADPAVAALESPPLQVRVALPDGVSASAMMLVSVVTVLPHASFTATCGCEARLTPPVLSDGCRVKATRVAGPAVTVNDALVPSNRPGDVAVRV